MQCYSAYIILAPVDDFIPGAIYIQEVNLNHYMDIAISMAKLAIGQTGMNPPVGAVIVKNGRIIGTGSHLKSGEMHAERAALQACIEDPEGADIYVTLEPCSHHGKTPPCTDAIIESGISRVYYAYKDNNDKVSGIQKLSEHGVEVIYSRHEAASELYRPFNIRLMDKRPYITLKCAQTLDGKMARQNGDSHWVSNSESRRDVHQIRQLHDGILIGAGTLIADDPLLTVRLFDNDKQPIPIVLLGSKVLNQSLNLLKHPVQPVVFTTNEQNLKFKDTCKVYVGNYTLTEILTILIEENVSSVLVEGGTTVHTQFINENLFDDLIIYIAPKIFGYSKYQLHSGVLDTHDGLILQNVEKLESDIKLTYRRTRQCLQD